MKQPFSFFAISFLLLLAWGCRNIVDIPGDSNNNPPAVKSIILADIAPDSLQLMPFALNKVTVNLDILTLNISYSGGCEEHEFELYMSPAVFMESFPLQANIYLKHNGNRDGCEAYLTGDISFDISEIAQSYRATYFSKAGTVVLNIYEYFEDSPSKTIQIIYSFL